MLSLLKWWEMWCFLPHCAVILSICRVTGSIRWLSYYRVSCWNSCPTIVTSSVPVTDKRKTASYWRYLNKPLCWDLMCLVWVVDVSQMSLKLLSFYISCCYSISLTDPWWHRFKLQLLLLGVRYSHSPLFMIHCFFMSSQQAKEFLKVQHRSFVLLHTPAQRVSKTTEKDFIYLLFCSS